MQGAGSFDPLLRGLQERDQLVQARTGMNLEINHGWLPMWEPKGNSVSKDPWYTLIIFDPVHPRPLDSHPPSYAGTCRNAGFDQLDLFKNTQGIHRGGSQALEESISNAFALASTLQCRAFDRIDKSAQVDLLETLCHEDQQVTKKEQQKSRK